MSDEITFETRGPLGLITLTRPKALNALTLEMIRLMHPQLDSWAEDDSIKAVAIRGAGDRAFCAGGDVRAVWSAGQDGEHSPGKRGHLAGDFFREEYLLNRRIHTFEKPYVALIDGIVMGGGVGLSIHGDIRLGGERSLFAMPETAIGLFPDVGGSYFLPRLPLGAGLGLYLALTGNRLKAVDCLTAGIATHLIGDAEEEAIISALEAADWSLGLAGGEAALLPLTQTEPPAGSLEPQLAAIKQCFTGKASVESVIEALEALGNDWAKETLETLSKRSPTSLKVAFEQLRQGAALDFDDCMIMEYRLSQAAMRPGSDFYEGIRAVLVDKDHAPLWNPDSLAGVTSQDVGSWFAPLGDNDLSF
ncbi:MAG: enoyl-CoA hydratase/isomerase family protein [Pseudomonadota bacterium]